MSKNSVKTATGAIPKRPTYSGGFLWGPTPLASAVVQACTGVVAVAMALSIAGPPDAQALARKFTTLSNPQGTNPETYSAGVEDAYFIAFMVLFLTALRAFVNNLIFGHMARAFDVSAKLTPKFMEQGWTASYYTWAFCTGLYIMTTEWGFSTDDYWTSYPHIMHTGIMKAYYLVQLSFWIHMIFVTIVEPWRADFPAMMAHHFITSGLIGFSWSFNFVRVGTAILVEQDFADVFLPIAKMLKYAKRTTACDVMFALFAVAWIPTRHGIFFYIYASCYYDSARLIPGEGQVWNPSAGTFGTPQVMNYFLIVLAIFQCLLLYWLKALITAVYRAITSTGKIDDQRSGSDVSEDDKTD